MKRTESLTRIDLSLKSFVALNNIRNKQNINSIFMNGSQLKQFYHGMREIHNQASSQKNNSQKNCAIGKKKSHSLFNKENLTIDWRNAIRAGMSQKPLITNFETKTEIANKSGQDQYLGSICSKGQGMIRLQLDFQLPKVERIENINEGQWPRISQNFDDPLTPPSDQTGAVKINESRMKLFETTFQEGLKMNGKMLATTFEQKPMDLQELTQLRRQQQEKYINQHRKKLGRNKAKNKQSNGVYLEQNIQQQKQKQDVKLQDKLNKKLNDCFDRYLEHYANNNHLKQTQTNKDIEMFHNEKKELGQVPNSIETYFIKKSKHLKTGTGSKEQKMMAKQENSRKNMNIILKAMKAMPKH